LASFATFASDRLFWFFPGTMSLSPLTISTFPLRAAVLFRLMNNTAAGMPVP
jgi:hypothetical protein